MLAPPRLSHIAGLLAALAATGCNAGQRLYPVEGTVLLEDGSPATVLSGGLVSLESVADKSNASGQIEPDGTFRIKTPLGQGGARAGVYRVLVRPPEGADRNHPPIDRRYGRYDTSGIEITVNDGPNTVTVTVQRRGKDK
jgi:hypothetical protein